MIINIIIFINIILLKWYYENSDVDMSLFFLNLAVTPALNQVKSSGIIITIIMI